MDINSEIKPKDKHTLGSSYIFGTLFTEWENLTMLLMDTGTFTDETHGYMLETSGLSNNATFFKAN